MESEKSMSEIRRIDQEEYAAEALELLNNEREDFVRSACSSLSEGVSSETTRGILVRKVKSEMKHVLFEHLKRSGTVSGHYVYRYTYGYCRKVRVESRESDVPSKYLDIEKVLTNFDAVIDDIMVEAGKRKMIAEIEAVTKEAQEKR